MHILLGLVGVLGGIVFWIWKVKTAASVAREVVDTVGDVRAAVRRLGYGRGAGELPLEAVEDTRLAAAGILVAFAKMDGDCTREQIAAIQNECARVFEASEKEAEQFTASGRWLAHQLSNPDEVVRKLSKSLSKTLTHAQGQALLGMAERVSAVEGGGLSDAQKLALKRLSEALG